MTYAEEWDRCAVFNNKQTAQCTKLVHLIQRKQKTKKANKWQFPFIHKALMAVFNASCDQHM